MQWIEVCIKTTSQAIELVGERLTMLPGLPDCRIVLCKPDFGIPTPALFARADGVRLSRRPDVDGMVQALTEGNLEGITSRLCNVFEELLPEEYREVFRIREQLLKLGALNAAMSGSGPTVFGLFRQEAAARQAAQTLQQMYQETYCVRPVGKLH